MSSAYPNVYEPNQAQYQELPGGPQLSDKTKAYPADPQPTVPVAGVPVVYPATDPYNNNKLPPHPAPPQSNAATVPQPTVTYQKLSRKEAKRMQKEQRKAMKNGVPAGQYPPGTVVYVQEQPGGGGAAAAGCCAGILAFLCCLPCLACCCPCCVI